MEPIKNLFGNLVRPPQKKRRTERGELLEYFHFNVNLERDGTKYPKLPIGAVAWKLQGLTVKDLYYLKSITEDARRRGEPWGKVFWGSLKSRDNQ
jgi:hypothetical protein